MYYWYTLWFDFTSYLYDQYALLLAAYNFMVWCVQEVLWFILPNHGIWWNKKYKINWRRRKQYCPRFYSRSRKRGSRVCNKTAQFTSIRKRGSRKSSSTLMTGTVFRIFPRMFSFLSDWSQVGKLSSNTVRIRETLVCTSTTYDTGTRTKDPNHL